MQFAQRSMPLSFPGFFFDNEVWIYGTCASQVETYFIGKLVEVSGPTIEEIYAASDRQTFNVFKAASFGLEAPPSSPTGPTPFPTYLQSSLSVRPKGTSTN